MRASDFRAAARQSLAGKWFLAVVVGLVAYLLGGDENDIAHTIVNSLAITSGIVCDGAKSSCAAKIATAVETGIFGYEMYRNGQQFYAGDGLVVKGVENSINNFGRLARIGMRGTDEEIIRLMTEETPESGLKE